MKILVTVCVCALSFLTLSAQDTKKIEEQAKAIADDLCGCLDKAENSDDVMKCSIDLKSKYPDYNKEEVPQELRDELKSKIEGCMESNYKRINANVPAEIIEKNNKMGKQIAEKLCDCYGEVEESKQLRDCSASVMSEYKEFEKDKMDYDKRNEVDASINACIKENLKRLENK